MSERVRRYLADDDRPMELRVGSEREGWRARLANVERLLTIVQDNTKDDTGELGAALAEVRSMIDGDETTEAS